MVCINVWLRIGLSRYTVEQLGASKPVSHMAQTKTIRSGSLVSLNLSSSPGSESFIRRRCGSISNPSFRISEISFCPGDTIRAISVSFRIFRRSKSKSFFSLEFPCLAKSCFVISITACQCLRTLSCIFRAVALSIETTIAFPKKPLPKK